jgi:hypothetical protein
MLSLVKQVLCEYWPLLMKMALVSTIVPVATSNFDLLCDVKNLLFLVCLIPMLETKFLGEVSSTS